MNIRLAPIGDFVEPIRTWNPAITPDKTFNYVDLSAVDQIDKQIKFALPVRGSEAPSRARQLISKGDILVSTVRPNLNGVAPVTDAFDGATASTGFCVLRPRSEKLASNYLMHWVRSPKFIDHMVREATGASYPAVSDRIIKASHIPLPPFNEQRRIAAILDKADALRRARRKSIKQLETLCDAQYLCKFGDPIRNDFGWSSITLDQALERGYVLEIQDGNHGERHPKVADFVATGIPFITANCLRNGILNTEEAYKLNEAWLSRLRVGFSHAGDLLLSHKGTVGEVAVVPQNVGRVILSPQVTYYRTGPELDARFLLGTFRTRPFQALLAKAAKQSTRAYIGITKQREMRIIVPPIAVQRQFSSVVAKIDDLIGQYREHLSILEFLFFSLQSCAFSGQL